MPTRAAADRYSVPDVYCNWPAGGQVQAAERGLAPSQVGELVAQLTLSMPHPEEWKTHEQLFAVLWLLYDNGHTTPAAMKKAATVYREQQRA